MRLAADTIAALSTPTGVSALAVLRTSGPASARLAREVCGETPPPRHAHHADYRGITGELIDDVVLTFFAGPNSYTGEDVLEITCHGNPLITQLILGDLLARGCRLAEPGEFTRRAFLNGRIDLNQAEAVMEVIHARSERALALAQRQLRGGFGESLQVIERELRDASARIEAYIDFPEEDLPPEDRGAVLAVVDGALRAVDRLLATSRRTALVRDGVKVVIVGEPNAGKSSLLNRLLGRERALVSAEPGTTRDFIEESMLLDGHRLRLIDTAGLNPSAGALERLGIGKTLEHSSVADLFLWIADVTAPVRELPPVLRQRMSPANTVAVLNKTDLLPHSTATASGEGTCSIGGFAAIPLSVLTGDGWEALLGALRERLRGLTTGIDDGDGSDIAVSMRQEQVLAAVRENLAAAREKLAAESAPTELIATDLRAALDAGAQAGRSDNEQVLDRLFASFCIGK